MFGKVTKGMDIAERISKQAVAAIPKTGLHSAPQKDIIIYSVELLSGPAKKSRGWF